MSDPSSTASDLFAQGFNCSQSVLAAFASELSLPSEVALRLAAPFGGGMGRMGEVCGAVCGAFMVIGLRNGYTVPGNEEAKSATYSIVRSLADRFRERNGSILCHELLGLSIGSSEGLEKARELRLIENRCTKFVRDAVELLNDKDAKPSSLPG